MLKSSLKKISMQITNIPGSEEDNEKSLVEDKENDSSHDQEAQSLQTEIIAKTPVRRQPPITPARARTSIIRLEKRNVIEISKIWDASDPSDETLVPDGKREITYGDIRLCKSQGLLNDKIVNYYLELLLKNRKRCCAISSYSAAARCSLCTT